MKDPAVTRIVLDSYVSIKHSFESTRVVIGVAATRRDGKAASTIVAANRIIMGTVLLSILGDAMVHAPSGSIVMLVHGA